MKVNLKNKIERLTERKDELEDKFKSNERQIIDIKKNIKYIEKKKQMDPLKLDAFDYSKIKSLEKNPDEICNSKILLLQSLITESTNNKKNYQEMIQNCIEKFQSLGYDYTELDKLIEEDEKKDKIQNKKENDVKEESEDKQEINTNKEKEVIINDKKDNINDNKNNIVGNVNNNDDNNKNINKENNIQEKNDIKNNNDNNNDNNKDNNNDNNNGKNMNVIGKNNNDNDKNTKMNDNKNDNNDNKNDNINIIDKYNKQINDKSNKDNNNIYSNKEKEDEDNIDIKNQITNVDNNSIDDIEKDKNIKNIKDINEDNKIKENKDEKEKEKEEEKGKEKEKEKETDEAIAKKENKSSTNEKKSNDDNNINENKDESIKNINKEGEEKKDITINEIPKEDKRTTDDAKNNIDNNDINNNDINLDANENEEEKKENNSENDINNNGIISDEKQLIPVENKLPNLQKDNNKANITVSKKDDVLSNEEFSEFTYILIKNFECKKINEEAARQKIIMASTKEEIEKNRFIEQMSFNIMKSIHCEHKDSLAKVKIWLNTLLSMCDNDQKKMTENFLSLFSNINIYTAEQELIFSKKIKKCFLDKKEIIFKKLEPFKNKYISFHFLKQLIEEQNIELKDEYTHYLFYELKKFDDPNASLYDLKVQNLFTLLENSQNDSKMDTESDIEITNEQYVSIITNFGIQLLKYLDTNKTDLRTVLGDLIQNLSSGDSKDGEKMEVILIEPFVNRMREIGIKLTSEIEIYCLFSRYKLSDEYEIISVNLLEKELENFKTSNISKLAINDNNINGMTNINNLNGLGGGVGVSNAEGNNLKVMEKVQEENEDNISNS